MNIKKGGKYRTRAGQSATITNDGNSSNVYPFIGKIAGIIGTHVWTRNGKYFSSGTCNRDLVAVSLWARIKKVLIG